MGSWLEKENLPFPSLQISELQTLTASPASTIWYPGQAQAS